MTEAATSAAATPPWAEPTSITWASASPSTASRDRADDVGGVRRLVAADQPQPPAVAAVGPGEVGDVAARGDPLHGHAARADVQRRHQLGQGARHRAVGGRRPGPPPAPTPRGRRRRRAAPRRRRPTSGRRRARAARPARPPGPGRRPATPAVSTRPHLQPVEQPATSAGDVLHQLGVAVGELARGRPPPRRGRARRSRSGRPRRSRRRGRPRARGSRSRGRRSSRGSGTPPSCSSSIQR